MPLKEFPIVTEPTIQNCCQESALLNRVHHSFHPVHSLALWLLFRDPFLHYPPAMLLSYAAVMFPGVIFRCRAHLILDLVTTTLCK